MQGRIQHYGKAATLGLLLLLAAGLQNGNTAVAAIRADDHGYLGVALTDLDDELRENLKFKEAGGALVEEVVEDSPADKAGLEDEDIILTFNGQKVRSEAALRELLLLTKPGDKAKVVVFRQGDKKTFTIVLGKSAEVSSAPKIIKKRMTMPHPMMMGKGGCSCDKECGYLGVGVQNLSEQLALYFKVKDGLGVLVASIEKDSPADKVGIKAGDVIVKINDEKIRARRDLVDALCDTKPNDEATVELLHEGIAKTIKVTLSKCSKENCAPGKGVMMEKGCGSCDVDLDMEGINPEEMKELHMELNQPTEELQKQIDALREELDQLKKDLRK